MGLKLEGSEIDGYKIVKHLADGAYTEVYLVTAPNGQDVILKALNPQLKADLKIKDEQLLGHFEHEIESMRRLRHEHIVALLKSGKSLSPEGVEFSYLMTEYMCGGTLKDYCQRSHLTLPQVLELFGPVCDALTYIHRNGIIHCDIKPSNLLLNQAVNPTLIKLADFSVAKSMKEGLAGDRIAVGTSPYAAPEHHPHATELERQQPLDTRADVYALAMTLLHVLTGTKPEFDRQQISTLPPHPVYQGYKHELERVLGRATAIRVERRYPTIEDFWREFKSVGASSLEYDETVVRARRSRVVVSIESDDTDARHRAERISLPEGAAIEIIRIPAGVFQRGTTPQELEQWVSRFPEYLQKQARTWLGWEMPRRKVTVESFWMSKYPVTQKQWRVVVTNLPEVTRDLDANPWEMRPGAAMRDDEHPITNVSWMEAYEFCARLSMATGRDIRLPSEAEWEYACRAGTTTPFNFPEHDMLDPGLLNHNGVGPDMSRPQRWRADKGTSAVGSLGGPNQFGLCDMHGNVWEWCTDAWSENYQRAYEDARPWESRNELLRVARGGSWAAFSCQCRSASRARFLYNEYFDDLGFRIVI
ncbi:MAG TPA: bifunctional serine/threonine-protein kinase/formylglycine-generating enzyme family protein [Pyrinomonadaceae bacterium]|jgi:formylglycine-generating enzyme required for sulfatase activity